MTLCYHCHQYMNTCPLEVTDSVKHCKEFIPMHHPNLVHESENPDHYRNKSIEPIDAIRSWLGDAGFVAYCRGNIIKYMARFGDKDAPISEAKKALVYQRWIDETLAGKELSK